jgi:hypothetical protein
VRHGLLGYVPLALSRGGVMNRAYRRSVIHDMRQMGCTCTPELTMVDAADLPEGARSGAYALHQIGCPINEWAEAANSMGVVPAVVRLRQRCEK